MIRALEVLFLRSLPIPTLEKVSASSLYMKRMVPYLLLIAVESYHLSSNHIPSLSVAHGTYTKRNNDGPMLDKQDVHLQQ
jgi:hypothetical protein